MNDRVARCQVLASVIAADGVIHPTEKAFLNHLMSKMGLSAEEQSEVVSLKYADEAETAVARLALADRRELLDQAVAAVLVDGKLSPEEKVIIDRLAKVLGFQG